MNLKGKDKITVANELLEKYEHELEKYLTEYYQAHKEEFEALFIELQEKQEGIK